MKPILGKRYTCKGPSHDYIQGDRARVIELIINEILPESKKVYVPCLCGIKNGQEVLLSNIDRWGFTARSVLCMNCGLIRIDPRWDDQTYAKIYQKYFWTLQTGFSEITLERFELSVKRAMSFKNFISENIDLRYKKVLEIGCSYGAALSLLKDTGAELTGYDYDDNCINFGRNYTGIDLRRGGIDDIIKENKKYDVIILRHVLEHLSYPIDEIMKIKKLLNERGLLYVEVPGIFNEKAIQNDPIKYFNVFHIFSYSLFTLSRIMENCSLSMVYGDERVVSLWKNVDRKIDQGKQNIQISNKILTYFIKKEKEYKKIYFINKLHLNRLVYLVRRISSKNTNNY